MVENHLRNFKFLRNSDIAGPFENYAAARTAAEEAFGNITSLQDGEIALYSYKLGTQNEDGSLTPIETVHTLLGIKRNGGIEILGNYDELTAEYKSYVASEIAKLDSEKTDTNNGVSVTVKQVDGKIDSVSVVAPSLTSAIEALDVDPFSLTTLNGDKLEGYQISEVDGKIVKGQTATTLLTFASAPTDTNKVVTQTEITGLNADVTSEDGVNVQVQVIEEGGIITDVHVTDHSVNAGDVNKAITTAIAGLESSAENATGDIKVQVSQANGELTSVVVTDTLADIAHSGAAADVTVAEGINGLEATNVQSALAELQGDITALQAIDPVITTVSAGTGISVQCLTTPSEGGENSNDIEFNVGVKFTVDTIKYTEGEKSGKTYIRIMDGETVISETDAAAFVKDGFLQSVTKDADTNELIFTWNTDAGIEETTIAISDLCDVYTADETYLHLNGYKFEHKTIEGLDSTNVHGITESVTVENTTEKTFQVPTLKVDAAGHVVSVDEKTVTIKLPVSIDTAIQGGAGVDTTYITTTVNRNATNKNQLDVTSTAVIGSVANDTVGLAEATEVKDYVDSQIDALKDYNTETTVSTAEESGIIVTPTITGADTTNEQRTYVISLETVTRVDNPTADGTAGDPSTSSFADNATTFTYVKAVNTDANGRVTGILTETITENFDAGTY